FFFSSRRRHTRSKRDWSSDVCSSDLRSSSSPVVPVDWVHHIGALTQERTHQVGTQSTGTTGDEDDLSVDGKGGVDGRHRIPFCQIGRASCRERLHSTEGDDGDKRNTR